MPTRVASTLPGLGGRGKAPVVNVKLDLREYKAALREIIRTDRKELTFVINDQGIRLMQAAIKKTKKVNAGQIRRELNKKEVIKEVFIGKSGRRLKRPKKIRARFTLAERLVNAQRVEHNEKPIFGARLKTAAAKLIQWRVASNAFIRAGWLPALQKFLVAQGRTPYKKFSATQMRSRADKLGGAFVAKPQQRLRAGARFWNDAIIPFGKFSRKMGNPLKYALAGINAAVVGRAEDMKRKVIERLNRVHKRHRAKRSKF